MIDEALRDDTDKTGARWHQRSNLRLLLRLWAGFTEPSIRAASIRER